MCFQTETGMLGPQYKPYRPNPRPWLVVIEVSTIHYPFQGVETPSESVFGYDSECEIDSACGFVSLLSDKMNAF